jgi:hypothetical protein
MKVTDDQVIESIILQLLLQAGVIEDNAARRGETINPVDALRTIQSAVLALAATAGISTDLLRRLLVHAEIIMDSGKLCGLEIGFVDALGMILAAIAALIQATDCSEDQIATA